MYDLQDLCHLLGAVVHNQVADVVSAHHHHSHHIAYAPIAPVIFQPGLSAGDLAWMRICAAQWHFEIEEWSNHC